MWNPVVGTIIIRSPWVHMISANWCKISINVWIICCHFKDSICCISVVLLNNYSFIGITIHQWTILNAGYSTNIWYWPCIIQWLNYKHWSFNKWSNICCKHTSLHFISISLNTFRNWRINLNVWDTQQIFKHVSVFLFACPNIDRIQKDTTVWYCPYFTNLNSFFNVVCPQKYCKTTCRSSTNCDVCRLWEKFVMFF